MCHVPDGCRPVLVPAGVTGGLVMGRRLGLVVFLPVATLGLRMVPSMVGVVAVAVVRVPVRRVVWVVDRLVVRLEVHIEA